jgi:hypothetical protein
MAASRPSDRLTAIPSADDKWNSQVEDWGRLLVVVVLRNNDDRGRGVEGRSATPTAAATAIAAATACRGSASAPTSLVLRDLVACCGRLPYLVTPGGRRARRMAGKAKAPANTPAARPANNTRRSGEAKGPSLTRLAI